MVAELWITGLPTPAKTRLIEALHARLASQSIQIRLCHQNTPDELELDGGRALVLHVHAQADADALVEARRITWSSRSPDLVLATEWEAVGRAVQRILDLLARRGVLSNIERT